VKPISARSEVDAQARDAHLEFREAETAAASWDNIWSHSRAAGDERAAITRRNALSDFITRTDDIGARKVIREDRIHVPATGIADIEVVIDVRVSGREGVLFVGQSIDSVEVTIVPELARRRRSWRRRWRRC